MSDECCELPHIPMSSAGQCPVCGCASKAVERLTVKAMLKSKALRAFDAKAQYFFCAQQGCDVAYHTPGQAFPKSELRVPVFQKDEGPLTPVCYCFGFTRDDVKSKAKSHEVSESIAAWVKAGRCACEVRNPQGACCLGHVRALESR